MLFGNNSFTNVDILTDLFQVWVSRINHVRKNYLDLFATCFSLYNFIYTNYYAWHDDRKKWSTKELLNIKEEFF